MKSNTEKFLITFLLFFFVESILAGNELIPVTGQALPIDPLNAVYGIEGHEIHLINGRADAEAAPGAVCRITTSVFGKPVYGDLDADGNEDAALLLIQSSGGSGTFYYATAALNTNGAYRGTNAVFLGDRIAPQTVEIRNGVFIANYADRRREEAMTTPPTVGKSKYLTFKDNELMDIMPLAEGEQVIEGWVTIGHEVRSFKPCSEKADYWLLGNSAVLKEVTEAHRRELPDRKRYAPLFMVLAGRVGPRPADGFGAGYDGSFIVTSLCGCGGKGIVKAGTLL